MESLDPSRLVFLDESGVTTPMTRHYGRAPGGERVGEATPQSHWRTLTVLSAITRQGVLASMTIEEATDGDVFLAYWEQVLCLKLDAGQVIIMDNLRAHKVEGVRKNKKPKPPTTNVNLVSMIRLEPIHRRMCSKIVNGLRLCH